MFFYSFVFSIIRLHQRLQLNNLHYLKIAEAIKKNTLSTEKILTLTRSEPEVIYYSGRRGENVHINSIARIREVLSQLNEYKDFHVLAITDFNIKEDALDVYAMLKKHKIIYEDDKGIAVRLQ